MGRAAAIAVVLAVIAVIGAVGGCSTATLGSDAAIDTGKAFDASIDGNGCSEQPCTILPQCGCGGPNACDLDQMDRMGNACRNILTPGTETDTCMGANTCDRGYTCVGGSGYAVCKRYCMGDADCIAPRGRCAIALSSMGAPIAGLPGLCSSNCDPTDTTPEHCPSTAKCTLFTSMRGGTSYKIADCSKAGTGTQGADCTGPTESMCAKGYQCAKFSTEANHKCRRICSAPGTTTPQCGGQMCVGFTEPHTLDGVTYGVCAP